MHLFLITVRSITFEVRWQHLFINFVSNNYLTTGNWIVINFIFLYKKRLNPKYNLD